MRPNHWFRTLPLRARSIFCRGQVERELAEEFQYHLDMKIEELIAAGTLPAEARYAALRAMGGLEQRKEECRDARMIRWIDEFRQDLRYSFRILAKNPGFTIVAILMLALGIGANTAIVSAIDALIFRQMPFGQIDRLVAIEPGANFPNYLDLRADDRVFSGVAAYMGLPLEARTPNSDLLSGRGVSANFFQVLGLNMTLGRGFLPEEEKLAGSQPVVVISYRLWERSFSCDPVVVGKLLRLNGEPLMIMGVAPRDFRDVAFGGSQDVWVPFPMFVRIVHLEKEPEWRESIERRDMGPWLTVIARLKPAVTLQQAKARMDVFTSDLEKANPGTIKNWKPTVVPESRARWPKGNALFFSAILTAAGLCLLLITCTNIANLLLARGSARQREIATRLALGAGRGRIVRQLLAEGLTLSALALIVSLLVCRWTIQALPAFEDSIGSTFSLVLGVDRRALFFAICIGVLTNLMFGLAPAFVVSRTDLSGALKSQGFLSYRRNKIPWRRALMDLQVSAAGDPIRVINSITDVCQSVNPKVTMNNPRLMAERTASLLSQERAAASVLTVFGLLALVLAAIGLYGIISYSVAQRTHEFGIRMALGAQNADILKQVISEGMALVALGLAIGLPCSMALSRLVESRMHGLSPLHPGVYAIVPIASFAVALCAVILPARRASADPMNALRME